VIPGSRFEFTTDNRPILTPAYTGHRFTDQCRKVGVPRELRFALEGHATSDVGDSYGSEGYPMRVLAEAVSKLTNPLRPTSG